MINGDQKQNNYAVSDKTVVQEHVTLPEQLFEMAHLQCIGTYNSTALTSRSILKSITQL